ncbi:MULTISPECIES: hypothetical protein [unclassified Thiocapsa]
MARLSPAKDDNLTSERLGLPEEINERISQEIARLIEITFR